MELRTIMSDVATKQRFIELRAQGKSFAYIANEIQVSKTTLVDWSKDLTEEISNLRALELDALQEQYKIGREHRIKLYGEQLEAVREELKNRDLSDVPTVKLLELQLKTIEILKNEETMPLFTKTTPGIELEDFQTTKSWSV